MYCPECGDEFRPGFDRCPDCDVALVDRPREAPDPRFAPPGAVRPEPTVTFVPVFQTGNAAAFALAKSLLLDAGIYFHDAGYGLLDAFAGPSVVEVPETEAERARELLRELDADLTGS